MVAKRKGHAIAGLSEVMDIRLVSGNRETLFRGRDVDQAQESLLIQQ